MLRSHERKSGENDTENVQIAGKPERPANTKTALLRDKDINRGYLTTGSTKASEKDPGLQKNSVAVYNEKIIQEGNRVIPAKRSLGRRISSPAPKRVVKERQVEYAPPKEEEIPWAPDFDLDFSAFDSKVDVEAYEDMEAGLFRTTRRQFELESIKEDEVEVVDSPLLDTSIASPTLTTADEFVISSTEPSHPSTIEYAPPKEKELDDIVPAVKIDLTKFTSIVDEPVYNLSRLFDGPIEFPVFEDEDGFGEVPPLDEDALEFNPLSYFSLSDEEEEEEEDDDLTFQIPFEDHLFDVDNLVLA